MYFQHAAALWRDFPALVPGVLYAEGITGAAAAGPDHLTAIAGARLADGPESEFSEIQAWRRAFAQMGLKPTQYRCASDVRELTATLTAELGAVWSVTPPAALLTPNEPRFTFGA